MIRAGLEMKDELLQYQREFSREPNWQRRTISEPMFSPLQAMMLERIMQLTPESTPDSVNRLAEDVVLMTCISQRKTRI